MFLTEIENKNKRKYQQNITCAGSLNFKMESQKVVTVVKEEEQKKSAGVDSVPILAAKIGENDVVRNIYLKPSVTPIYHHSEFSLAFQIVREICKHLTELLAVRLVNKKWCRIASGILKERSNIWIKLIKKRGCGNDELKSWTNLNTASKNNSTLAALDRLLNANSNFPCQNYFISVGIQGHDGTPSTFIVKWIDRIKSLHFDVKQIPYALVFENFMPKTGFVAVQNVRNLQVEHGPFDWGIPRGMLRSNAPRLDRLRKLILPGNLVCDRASWREVLNEAVNLERIENCTLPFLPEIIKQNKVKLVKSLYLKFLLKPNPAIGLTLQENINVFVQAVDQGLQLEDILAFDIEYFILPYSKASRSDGSSHQYERLPPEATLNQWYKNIIQAFNKLLINSAETLQGVQSISCLGYASKGTTTAGCATRIEIPRMSKMREIDWLTLHEDPLMKMDALLPLANDGFSASQCFPNVESIMCDPSKECWANLSMKRSSEIQQFTGKLSMPSASKLYWFCSHLDFIGHQSINRSRDCNLIQHLIHPIFPNLTLLYLQHLILSEMPNVLAKVCQFYSGTLQELELSNRRNELLKQSTSKMWLLDTSITGWPQSFLEILRENFKNVDVETVKLLQTRPSIRSMKCKSILLCLHLKDLHSFHIPSRFAKTDIQLVQS